MILGIAALVAAYVLSQFYRAFLAVLAPVLGTEIGATPEDLAAASGLWFLAFAAMQIPVGAALDRLCPNGIDVNFENVGGKIMDTVIARLNDFSRMPLCGLISTYNATAPVPGTAAGKNESF